MSVINFEKLGIKNWTTLEMSNPQNMQFLEEIVADFSMTLSLGDAHEMYLILGALFERYSAEVSGPVQQAYRLMLKKLKILSLPDLDEDTEAEIFSSNLLFIFKNKLPIMNQISIIVRWDKEAFIQNLAKIRGYMQENTENIGDGSLGFQFSDPSQSPVIKNWIKDYIIFAGSPSDINSLSFNNYFNQNKNVNLLPADQKIYLK